MYEKRNNKGFSLAEMMIVMLIVSIVLAVSGPMLTKQQQVIERGSVPTGTVVSFIGNVAPDGWLLCNGQSTSGHTALAALVGANVPNLNDRFIVGAGTTYTVGNTGGVDSVLLTGAQSGLLSHTHTVNDNGHSHTGHISQACGYGGLNINGKAYYGCVTGYPTSNNTTGITINNNTAQNASESHENRPPYYALTYIIKD
jgi:prepilin-type N-terminal cleavage/methylation domain-containing protein